MKIQNRKRLFDFSFVLLLLFLVLLIDRFLPASSMWRPVLKKFFAFSLAAASLNLLYGFTGLFSLGQAGFMMLGAITYAVFTIPEESRHLVFRNWGESLVSITLPIPISLILAGIVAALFALLIALPSLRLKSDYFAVATLSFAEMLRGVFQSQYLARLTNGPDPIHSFAVPESLLFYAAVSGGCVFLIALLLKSRIGLFFRAVRDDEIAADAMGVDLVKTKRLSFVISSFFSGIAGALLCMCNTSVSAVSFSASMSYQLLLIVVIGGVGSLSGTLIASFFYICSSEWWLKFLDTPIFLPSGKQFVFSGAGFRMVFFSVLIMLFVLVFRGGILQGREFSPYEFLFRSKGGSHAKK